MKINIQILFNGEILLDMPIEELTQPGYTKCYPFNALEQGRFELRIIQKEQSDEQGRFHKMVSRLHTDN